MNPASKLIALFAVLLLASCGTTQKPALVMLYNKSSKNPVALVNPKVIAQKPKSKGELPVLAPASDWKDTARVVGRFALRALMFSLEEAENRK